MATRNDSWRGGGSGRGAYTLTANSATQTPLTLVLAAGSTANGLRINDSAGSALFTLDASGNLTIAGTVNVTVNEVVTGNIELTGNLVVNGNSTIGNAATDQLNVYANSIFRYNATVWNDLAVNNDVYISHSLNFEDVASTPNSSGNHGKVYTQIVSGVIELHYIDSSGNIVQITSAGAIGGDSIQLDDDEYLGIGNTAAAPDIRLGWNTAQTVDALYLGLSDGQNTFIIAENGDRAYDFAHGAQTNPTVFFHSAAQSGTQYVSITHDQTNGVINTGAGNLTFTGAARYTFNVGASITTSVAGTSGLLITNNTDAASVITAIFEGDRATVADGDEAYITFRLSDSGGTQDEGARITWKATTVASGATQDTDLIFSALVNNSLTTMLTLDGSASEIVPAVAINSAAAITGTAITGTSFVIGANTLTTTEWAFLDGQDQSVFTTSNPTFGNLTITSFAANWTNAGRTVADLGVVTTVDINGGTVDGVTIGGASAGAGTFTSLVATSLDLNGALDLDVAALGATITNTADTASSQVAIFEGDRATIADGDEAYLTFRLSDSAGNQDEGARITWKATTVLSGATQDTDLIFSALVNNVLTESFRIDGSAGGFVGINAPAPSEWLEVNGNISITNNNRLSLIARTGTNGGQMFWNNGTGTNITLAETASNVYTFGNAVAGTAPSNNVLVMNTSTGAVGIGTGTPGALLHILNATDSASVQAAIFEGDRATVADGDEAYLTFRLSDSAGNQDEGARITWKATTVASGATQDTDLIFSALVNNSLTTMLTLDGSASYIVPAVGINAAGITSPDLGTVTTIDINGGTLDGVTIGGASAAALTATTGLFTGTLTRQQDQNGATQIISRNDTSGTAGSAQVAATLGAFTQYATLASFSALYTTSGLLAANSSSVYASGASAGLRLFTIDATQVIIGTNNTANLTIASGGAATFNSSVGMQALTATTGTFSGANVSIGAPVASTTILELGIDDATVITGTTIGDVTADGIRIYNASTTAGAGSYLQFLLGGTGTSTAAIAAIRDSADNNSLLFYTEGSNTITERMRIASDGDILIGATVNYADRANKMEINSSGAPVSGLALNMWSATAGASQILEFNHSLSDTVGTHAGVTVDGSVIGGIEFNVSDGTNFESSAAIFSYIDGTGGDNDTPGRLVFLTTPNGSTTLSERMRISSDGTVDMNDRFIMNGTAKTLTDAATSLFDITLTAGSMTGGAVMWTIEASDGTDHQALSGVTTWAAVNKAGAYTTTVNNDTANDSKAVSAGTLTTVWDLLTGTNKVTLRVTPTGSLTETTYRVTYQIINNTASAITIL